MLKGRKSAIIIFLAVMICALGMTVVYLNAASVGQVLGNVSLFTSNDQPGAYIPDLGRKVITVFYTDPDVRDLNEPLRDYLKAKNYPKDTYRGLGVANLKDTWIPNAVLRSIIRGKERKFDAVVLTDKDHSLATAWGLGSVDDKDIVIVIGKDRRVLYINTGAVRGAEIQRVAAIIDQALAAKAK